MKKLIISVLVLIVGFFMYQQFNLRRAQNTPVNTVSSPPTTSAELPTQNVKLQDKNIIEDTPTYEMRVTYPQASGITNVATQDKINLAFKDFAEKSISEFKKEIQTINDIPSGQKSGLFIDYDLVQLSRQMISLKFNVSNYTAGAAHPNNFVHAWTYNFVNDKPISGLEDVFDSEKNYLKTLSDIAREEIKNQFNADWQALESDVIEGTEPTQENFSEFSIARNTLNLYFNPYQVAPYAVGLVEVKIPYEKIQHILRDDFVFKTK